MKIEIKGLKHSEFASHDSNCFEAAIYVNGKKAGRASNDGWGGPTSIVPNALAEQIDAWLNTMPARPDGLPHSAELHVSELVENALRARIITAEVKKLQRQVKQNRIVVLTGHGELVASKPVAPVVMEKMVKTFTEKPETMRTWTKEPAGVNLFLVNTMTTEQLTQALNRL